MIPLPIAQRIVDAGRPLATLLYFFKESVYRQRRGDPTVADFCFGNPHEMPLPGFVDALQQAVEPRNKDWFAYKDNEPESRAVVATTLGERIGLQFEDEDIFLTNGAFAAFAVALATLLDPGDEVIFISPPWFFYESLILAYGGKPVRVRVDPVSFDLDLDAIAAAITPRTRAVIINSPNNPTGKIYDPPALESLAGLLEDAGARYGRPITLLSDEAYSRIVFDGRRFHSPARFYAHTWLLYTYGKTLLAPGQRIGYIALSPSIPDREALRGAIFTAQLVTGWSFPNALLQHALPSLENVSIDIDHLQRKRDRMVAALRDIGYELHVPEGTFYLVARAPIPDDLAFCNRLATHDVLCLPGTIVELPGHIRISLTASDAMIDRAIPGFAAAFHESREAVAAGGSPV